MTSRLSFISLKWKTFLLLSLALSFIFVAEYIYVSNNLKHNIDQERENLGKKYLADIELITDQYKDRLNLMTAGMLKFSNINYFLSSNESEELQNRLTAIWATMENNYQLESVYLFNRDKKKIAAEGKTYTPIYDTNLHEVSGIVCHLQCSIYFILPAFEEGELIGYIQYTTGINWLIKSFSQHTGVKIGITGLGGSTSDNELKGIENQISGEILSSVNGSYYYLSTLKDFTNGIHWSFTQDITSAIEYNQDFKKQSIFFIFIKLLLCQICLFWALWRPLTRLKNVTQHLPRLASNYDDFIAHYEKRNRKHNFPDESNIVQFSALHLAKRLRFLNEKVEKRTKDLEDNALQLKSEKLFSDTLLNTAQAIILTMDSKGNILSANNYALKITGYEAHELINQPLNILLNDPEDKESFEAFIQDLDSGEQTTMQFHYDLKSKFNELVHMAWYSSELDMGGEHQIMTIGIDVSDRKRVEEHLSWLANIDSLTNLYNRRRFTEELDSVIASSHRYHHTSAVLFFDLDNFKDVNDLSGHQAGDDLLIKVAEVLNANIRESDMVARLGGDEFAIIIKETNQEDAITCAQRFCKALNDIEIKVSKHTHKVSSSIGVALYPDHGNDIKTLLANADSAMYRAKELGRNRVFLFDRNEVTEKSIKQRVYWNQKAQEVIANKDVTMHYQPIWNLADNSISHYEALLRIKENGQLISPVELIQAAERNNIIYDLDLLVLDHVFSDMRDLAHNGIKPRVNINISGLSFQNKNLVTNICDFITLYNVDPSQLTCEITETAAAADVAVTTHVMEQLKSLGINMALDDFGVGFSSIYYLKHFPIDYIKIDGSFIKNLHSDEESQALVKAITQVAKAFGQSTVAEFVEQEETVEKLNELGVTYAQGYHLSRPSPIEDCFPILKDLQQASN